MYGGRFELNNFEECGQWLRRTYVEPSIIGSQDKLLAMIEVKRIKQFYRIDHGANKRSMR